MNDKITPLDAAKYTKDDITRLSSEGKLADAFEAWVATPRDFYLNPLLYVRTEIAMWLIVKKNELYFLRKENTCLPETV